MAKYTFTCGEGHDAMTMEAEAMNDDDAMAQMMGQCKSHLGEHHADMANKSDDELKEMIMQGWQKSEEQPAM